MHLQPSISQVMQSVPLSEILPRIHNLTTSVVVQVDMPPCTLVVFGFRDPPSMGEVLSAGISVNLMVQSYEFASNSDSLISCMIEKR